MSNDNMKFPGADTGREQTARQSTRMTQQATAPGIMGIAPAASSTRKTTQPAGEARKADAQPAREARPIDAAGDGSFERTLRRIGGAVEGEAPWYARWVAGGAGLMMWCVSGYITSRSLQAQD